MDIEPGYYIKLTDAIDALSLYSEATPDGITPQQAVRMIPRIWAEKDAATCYIEKREEDLSTLVNLYDCTECIYNQVFLSMMNTPFNQCKFQNKLLQNPKINHFRCTKFKSKDEEEKKDDE